MVAGDICVLILPLPEGQPGKANCVFIQSWWSASADATHALVCVFVCVCVVLNQGFQSAVYLFGLSVFIPERECDAALCSYAFIWKIGQFPWESLSLSLSLSLCLILQPHLFLSVNLFLFSHPHPSFSIFSNRSFFFSPFSPLSHLLPASFLSLTHGHSLTHTQALACSFAPTRSHT